MNKITINTGKVEYKLIGQNIAIKRIDDKNNKTSYIPGHSLINLFKYVKKLEDETERLINNQSALRRDSHKLRRDNARLIEDLKIQNNHIVECNNLIEEANKTLEEISNSDKKILSLLEEVQTDKKKEIMEIIKEKEENVKSKKS